MRKESLRSWELGYELFHGYGDEKQKISSVSTFPDVAEGFYNQKDSAGKMPVFITLECSEQNPPKGATSRFNKIPKKFLSWSKNPNEHEIILDHKNNLYSIKSIEYNPEKKRHDIKIIAWNGVLAQEKMLKRQQQEEAERKNQETLEKEKEKEEENRKQEEKRQNDLKLEREERQRKKEEAEKKQKDEALREEQEEMQRQYIEYRQQEIYNQQQEVYREQQAMYQQCVAEQQASEQQMRRDQAMFQQQMNYQQQVVYQQQVMDYQQNLQFQRRLQGMMNAGMPMNQFSQQLHQWHNQRMRQFRRF